MQKIDFFKEKMVSRVVFIKLKFRWLQTGLSDWKKTPNNWNFAYGGFLRIFLNVAILKIFKEFWNSPLFPGKIVKCT